MSEIFVRYNGSSVYRFPEVFVLCLGAQHWSRNTNDIRLGHSIGHGMRFYDALC
jgi:hypothetical protein